MERRDHQNLGQDHGQNLGRWTARPADEGQEPPHLRGVDDARGVHGDEDVAVAEDARDRQAQDRHGAQDLLDLHTTGDVPPGVGHPVAPAGAPSPDRLPNRRGRGGRRGFWVGLVLGSLPLILLISGLAGYFLADGGGGADGATGLDPDGSIESATSSAASSTIPESTVPGSSVQAPGPLAVVTTEADAAMATGLVTADLIEVDGAVPESLRPAWSAELAGLAEAIGRRLADRSEPTALPDGELTVMFPGAARFVGDSPNEFDGTPHALLDDVARSLRDGTALLTVVGYADPTQPQEAHLALFRAEHVHDHLGEYGIDPLRLAVEIRAPAEAPTGAGAGPVDQRVDLEFHYGS